MDSRSIWNMSSKLKRTFFFGMFDIYSTARYKNSVYIYMRGCVACEASVSVEFRLLSVFWMRAKWGESKINK